jgi:hypothetical protein
LVVVQEQLLVTLVEERRLVEFLEVEQLKLFLNWEMVREQGVVVEEVLWLLWVLVTGPELFVLE